MFNKKIIFIVSCFFLLIVITSIIKNNTRNLEKDIFKLKNEISLLEKQISDAEIDFVYLSNPERIQKELTDFGDKKYLNYEHSKIFHSINEFLKHSSKETKFLKNKSIK
tara:strand:- start:434 stop:760 length:327 start_codon:yes stop_codon:yes gene_type:complete